MSETHQRHFRGGWMRPEIFDLMEKGVITAKESILLMVVDSLVKTGGDDCYASNEYLGGILRSKRSQIKLMISHLRELGLLIQTGFNGRKRFMVTAWSHLPQGVGKPTLSGPETQPADLEGTSREREDISAVSPRNGKELHPRWFKMAHQLGKAIAKVRKVNNNSKATPWALSLRLLSEKDGITKDRIRRVMNWYCGQLQEGDLIRNNPNYVPVAYSGQAFREKFLRIEDAMNRQLQDEGESSSPSRIKMVREGVDETDQD